MCRKKAGGRAEREGGMVWYLRERAKKGAGCSEGQEGERRGGDARTGQVEGSANIGWGGWGDGGRGTGDGGRGTGDGGTGDGGRGTGDGGRGDGGRGTGDGGRGTGDGGRGTGDGDVTW